MNDRELALRLAPYLLDKVFVSHQMRDGRIDKSTPLTVFHFNGPSSRPPEQLHEREYLWLAAEVEKLLNKEQSKEYIDSLENECGCDGWEIMIWQEKKSITCATFAQRATALIKVKDSQ